jgi:hypothetical protein
VRENAKYKCGLGFAKQFCGRRIRKTETDFFEIRRDWVSAPQEGAGGMRGGFFFWRAGIENKIEYLDFASGVEKIDGMVEKFNQSIISDAEIVWIIRGGNKCIQTLDKLDWDNIVKSNKPFYGLSDFTHFSTMAVSKGITCFYGQGLTRIKQYFPTENDRKFIADFLKQEFLFQKMQKLSLLQIAIWIFLRKK